MLAELCNDCGNEMYTWHECEDGVCERCLHEEETRYLALEEDAKWESLVDEAEMFL